MFILRMHFRLPPPRFRKSASSAINASHGARQRINYLWWYISVRVAHAKSPPFLYFEERAFVRKESAQVPVSLELAELQKFNIVDH